MKTTPHLPENYREIYALDLNINKESALYINLFGALIITVMAAVMNFIIPITSLFDQTEGVFGLILRILVIILLLPSYIVLHELTHGIAMKLCGCHKVTYGFSGMYAYAGCHEFFTKTAYLTVALAPVFFWGVLITVICWILPASWFWVFYILQIANIAGAAGDYYITCQFYFLPDDILVYDTGTEMTVYSSKSTS